MAPLSCGRAPSDTEARTGSEGWVELCRRGAEALKRVYGTKAGPAVRGRAARRPSPVGQRVIHSPPKQCLKITTVPSLQGTIGSRGSRSPVGPSLHAGKGELNQCGRHRDSPTRTLEIHGFPSQRDERWHGDATATQAGPGSQTCWQHPACCLYTWLHPVGSLRYLGHIPR